MKNKKKFTMMIPDLCRTNEYRCSCCNEIKLMSNCIYKKWDALKKPENCNIVVICRKCHFAMKKAKMERVESYLNSKE